MVATPNGDRPIEQLKVGDIVMAVQDDMSMIPAKIWTLFSRPCQILVLHTKDSTLRTTDEHPMWMGGHIFKHAGELSVGEFIMKVVGDTIVPTAITAITTEPGEEMVYNIEVDGPHTYIAGGFVVHNKGSIGLTPCFPCDTGILTASGITPIQHLAAGDTVIGVSRSGESTPVRVHKATSWQNVPVLHVETSSGVLRTTAQHPVWMGGEVFRAAGKLVVGDAIMMFVNGLVEKAVVTALTEAGSDTVYNIEVDGPATFVADGFVVH